MNKTKSNTLSMADLPWIKTRSRLHVRLSPAERKSMLLLIDLLLLNSALFLSVVLWNDFPPTLAALLAYVKWFLSISVLWILFGGVLDLFSLTRATSGTAIFLNTTIAVILTVGVYILTPWLTPPILSRSYVYGLAILSMGSLLVWRLLFVRIFTHPNFYQRAIILGKWRAESSIVQDIRRAGDAPAANPFRGTGYQIVGYVDDHKTAAGSGDMAIPWLGAPSQMAGLARSMQVDEIIVAVASSALLDVDVHEVMLDCREMGIRISDISQVYERLTTRFPVVYAHRNTDILFSSPDQPWRRLYNACKRSADILFALIGLIGLILLTPFVALANALWAPGSLFYRQERIGKGGRPFSLIKFRSMLPDAEGHSGAVWSPDHDPRITPVGRCLRKTRLDELPQFINVLRGEMSLIGPRPERPIFVGELVRQMPIYRARHVVRPGITGWAQVRYRYGNCVEDARIKLEYDLYYIKNRGFYLDLLIFLRTIPVLLRLRGK